MTKEKIKELLDNTKVYVNGKSKEIQEKLFSFGYRWGNTNSTEVHNTESPFIFIYKGESITHVNDMCYFTDTKIEKFLLKKSFLLKLQSLLIDHLRPKKNVGKKCRNINHSDG